MKPCPFCGVTPVDDASEIVSIAGNEDGYAVGCDHCGVVGPTALTRDAAVRRWDDRPSAREIERTGTVRRVKKLIQWAIDERRRRDDAAPDSPQRQISSAEFHAFRLSAWLMAEPLRRACR